MRVEIWSDIACPWCYIGKARFEKGLAEFAHRDEVEVVHRSFELDPGRAKGDTEKVIDMLALKYGRTPEEARGMEANVAANAQAEGLGYRAEGRDHGSTFDIHRVLHLAKARGLQDELLSLAYRANFAEERSVFDDAVLADLAVEAGLDADEVRAVLADPAAYAEEVRADEREAAELGANAVPFFVFDRRYGISGGQPSEVFVQALERAWKDRPVSTLTTLGGDAAACDADGACEVPQGTSGV
ncbi:MULTISPECIES: DsbA family oxidoreductase [Streptomyces]|uniref:DsbA family dithiol-disulfide isomerase n=1 Tax=Streptomyces clavifer TaxID=68188 RepID=A0ABS4VE83_9ACTN|nr:MULTISPECIES: DsbA family oxidoreductase [Streptomyces]KQX79647.1 protein-disulfide isomerase [Streptomyces sp. Root1319]KQZ20838.1 protein-disulfide isomerase [Streptomyces sp. Root55]MBP2362078.1 putative DsbA family dithiol-disulfide isomerase [Streptomyces clavifer]MDX2746552.1 DsbA family oxidoreductase [Streptomyces sp. NRRL_B-2557]RPK74813.1 DSBA-like thioredoxin domain protein [Streptomyces sp. ADI97-07]